MKKQLLLLPGFLGLALGSLCAQSWTPVPENTRPQTELRVQVDPAAPLDSLERQLVSAPFDQRGALATAFDSVNRSVEGEIASLNSQMGSLNTAASGNLTEARSFGTQAFRDLSLSTEETWQTSRHNALMALRKIRNSLETLKRTTLDVQS